MTLIARLREARTRRSVLAAAVALGALIAGLVGAGSISGTSEGFPFRTVGVSPALGASSRSGAASQSIQGVSAPTFFPNVKMPCLTEVAGSLACLSLLEPEVASGPDGTIYVTAQEGVPGGVNIWRRDPGSYEYVHINKPDANEPVTSETGFALGGGDNDLAITTDGRVLVATLSLVSAPVSYSTDRGETFTKVELANGLVNVDRMWLTTIGTSTVYYAYHDNQISQIWLVKSIDGGVSWSVPLPVLPPEMLPQSAGIPFVTVGNVQGDIVADPDGRVIMPFLAPKDLGGNTTPMSKPDSFYVAITDENGDNPTIHTVYEGDEDIMGLFPAVASDTAGNLYATWSNKRGVFLSISRDHGITWSAPRRISIGKGNTSTVFPFVIAGSTGRVALAWLGSDAASNNDTTAKWLTYYAVSTTALEKSPTWTQVVASDHVVHAGSICLDGLNCDLTGGNRSLAEVLQMGLTKDGRVIISYPGTSASDLGGWAYLAEQRFGPGLYANVAPNPPPLKPVKKTPGGIIEDVLRRVGENVQYFTAGGGGTGVSDPDGNEIDSLGDVGRMSPKPGDEGHVASANLWTTTFAGMPLTFEGEPFASNEIIGGKFTLTAFMQETLIEASKAAGEVGTINIRLVDIAPDGAAKEIATAGTNYETGIDVTQASYRFTIPKPWEVLKGHHLRAELSFTIFTSTDARFYYGNDAYPSGFTVERFARASSAAPKAVAPAPKSRVKPALPATGVGASLVLAILLLAAALATGRSVLRHRG